MVKSIRCQRPHSVRQRIAASTSAFIVAVGLITACSSGSGADDESVRGKGVQRASDLTPKPADAAVGVAAAKVMFCEPLQRSGIQTGTSDQIVWVPNGSVLLYHEDSCEPVIRPDGSFATTEGSAFPQYAGLSEIESMDNIVWTPATGELDGSQIVMTEEYLKGDAQERTEMLGRHSVTFHMTKSGERVFGSLTLRLSQGQLPLALFVDGVPLRNDEGEVLAPTIGEVITTTGITRGLSDEEAKRFVKALER